MYLAVLLFGYSLFAWSVVGVFKSHKDQDKFLYLGLKILTPSFWFYSVWKLWTDQPGYSSIGSLALCFLVLSLGLYFWSSKTAKQHAFTIVFSRDTPEKLVKSGPYSFVRHPVYLSYLVFYLSALVLTFDIISLSLFLCLLGLYLAGIIQEEKKFLDSPLQKEYLIYKSSTGALSPRLSRLLKGSRVE